jgi:type 2 lantibiotic biosynthesis protein LanM
VTAAAAPADPRLDPIAPEAAMWYLALTLEERLVGGASGSDAAAVEAGRALLAEWGDELALTSQIRERWLHAVGATARGAEAALGRTPRELQMLFAAAAHTQWLRGLLADLAGETGDDPHPLPPWTDPPDGHDLLVVAEPLLRSGVRRMHERAGAASAFESVPLEDLIAPLRTRLLGLLERPMALELHAAALLGTIPDDEQRYANFVAYAASHEGRLALLMQYPTLARLAWTWIDQWASNTAALMRALDDDARALFDTFGDVGRPVAAHGTDSDPHRGGQHVWFVDFGSGARLVYKPRPFAAERGFEQLAGELQAAGMEPQIGRLRAVDRGEHGWLEWAAAATATDAAAVAAFHQRQGALLLVLWLLAATDIHYENVVAAGGMPVVVDHETLLRSPTFDAAQADCSLRAEEQLGMSLQGVGLLPTPFHDAGLGGVIDQSGMGHGYATHGEIVIQRMVGAGTADMRMAQAPVLPPTASNRARRAEDGADEDPRDWVDEIELGFNAAWTFAASHSELVERAVSRFAGAVVRIVLRPTQNYLHLLEVIGHPEFLQDAVERERALMQLCMYPDDQHWREHSIGSERRQLLAGDVPWFGVRSGERRLLFGEGGESRGGIARSGPEVVRERIAALADADAHDRQLWVLRTSLAGWSRGAPASPGGVQGDVDDVVDHLVELLLGRAVEAGDQRTWLVMSSVPGCTPADTRFRPTRAALDLYDGLAGIALMLAAHAELRGSERSAAAARQAAATMCALAASTEPPMGAYDGAAGALWTALQLDRWLGGRLVDELAPSLMASIEHGLRHDRTLDIVSGAAGCIPVLLELEGRIPGAKDLAILCGRHLAAGTRDVHALRFARGFSHGASGMAWALGALARACDDDVMLGHARRLVREEDELLAGGRWTDDGDLAAWCHGAPGIALARLELAAIEDGEPAHLASARAALRATVHARPCDSHGLCHGELGLAEVLTTARALGTQAGLAEDELGSLVRERDQRVAGVLAQIRDTGPRCTTPRWLETPGLMNGIAGIAWGLLRAQHPDTLPALLLPGSLAEPVSTDGARGSGTAQE